MATSRKALALLELVYEGGEVLDLALEHQRSRFQRRLGEQFQSFDVRKHRGRGGREEVLDFAYSVQPRNVLVRGLAGALEAGRLFPQAHIFIDVIGRHPLDGGERALIAIAFRVKRVYVYARSADPLIRRMGIGRITRLQGPFLPSLCCDPPPTPEEGIVIGVTELYDGARDVLVQLKRMRDRERWPVRLASTMKMAGVELQHTLFDLAENCNLLVCPHEQADTHGPHEGALLALATERALCTSTTSAMRGLPYDGGYAAAERYAAQSYARGYAHYCANRATLDDRHKHVPMNPDELVNTVLQAL